MNEPLREDGMDFRSRDSGIKFLRDHNYGVSAGPYDYMNVSYPVHGVGKPYTIFATLSEEGQFRYIEQKKPAPEIMLARAAFEVDAMQTGHNYQL